MQSKIMVELEVGQFVEGVGWNSRIVTFHDTGQGWQSAEGNTSIKLLKVGVV